MRSKTIKRLLKIQNTYKKIIEGELARVNRNVNEWRAELISIKPAEDGWQECNNQAYRDRLNQSIAKSSIISSKLEAAHRDIKTQIKRFEILERKLENSERTYLVKKQSKFLEDFVFRQTYEKE